MNPERLITLLAAGATQDRSGSSACPDAHLVAGYVDGGLDEDSRAAVELHLADCGRCLEIVGSLCRERRPPERGQPLPRGWAKAPAWAAAAAILLAVPVVLHFTRNLDGRDPGQGSPPSPAVRTLASDPAGLRVLSPAPGSATDPRQLAFRWTEVAGSPFYDVRIVTDAGDVVVETRVTGTTWRPPVQLGLESGAEYFVHVEAYPSGDKAVSSEHVLFKVVE